MLLEVCIAELLEDVDIYVVVKYRSSPYASAVAP